MAENRDKPFLDEVDDSENLLTQEELKLSDQEEQEVEQRGRPRAAIIYEAVRIEGEREREKFAVLSQPCPGLA